MVLGNWLCFRLFLVQNKPTITFYFHIGIDNWGTEQSFLISSLQPSSFISSIPRTKKRYHACKIGFRTILLCGRHIFLMGGGCFIIHFCGPLARNERSYKLYFSCTIFLLTTSANFVFHVTIVRFSDETGPVWLHLWYFHYPRRTPEVRFAFLLPSVSPLWDPWPWTHKSAD